MEWGRAGRSLTGSCGFLETQPRARTQLESRQKVQALDEGLAMTVTASKIMSFLKYFFEVVMVFCYLLKDDGNA